ncbi:MAG: toprim domain-containing protein [Thermoplasmata archaeon]
MISEAERLEMLEEMIEELERRSASEPIIVEGPRDVRAMRELGITGIVKSINTGNSLVNFCAALAAEHDRFIIMTDWDRKGGHIAQLLRKGFEAADAKYDDALRRKIANLTKKELKDIEGFPAYLDRLRKSVEHRSPSESREEMRRRRK